ncbi:MAG TPA: hypothetical protein VIH11_07335 [Gemmatimonadaceae bacterium]
MRRPVIGVMGAASASAQQVGDARALGRLAAEQGWVVLTGGRDEGVMAAALAGAKEVPGSLTVGILPGASAADGAVAPGADVAIFTDLGHARNNVNVLSSRVVVACGVEGPGTTSEVALAIKNGRPVVLLRCAKETVQFFQGLSRALVREAADPAAAIEAIRTLLARPGSPR